MPKPKFEPKVSEKYKAPQINTETNNYRQNEPLRGREKAKEHLKYLKTGTYGVRNIKLFKVYKKIK